MAVMKYKDPVTGEVKRVGGVGVPASAVPVSNATAAALGLSSGASADAALAKLHTAKAPMYTYGTEEIEAGSPSTEPEGSLHFVIE